LKGGPGAAVEPTVCILDVRKTTFPFPFNNSLLEELGGVITINCPELFRSLLVVFCDLI